MGQERGQHQRPLTPLRRPYGYFASVVHLNGSQGMVGRKGDHHLNVELLHGVSSDDLPGGQTGLDRHVLSRAGVLLDGAHLLRAQQGADVFGCEPGEGTDEGHRSYQSLVTKTD